MNPLAARVRSEKLDEQGVIFDDQDACGHRRTPHKRDGTGETGSATETVVPFPWCALDRDAASLGPDEASADGQSEAQPARVRTTCPVERLEDALLLGLGQARAAVGDPEDEPLPLLSRRHQHRSSRLAE